MDKKIPAHEAAKAVLKKAEEMLKSSKLSKAPMQKPNVAKQEDSADMAMGEQDQTPADGVQQDPTPEHQPVERNGNPPWGTEPGHYKLARFMGHRDARRKQKPEVK